MANDNMQSAWARDGEQAIKDAYELGDRDEAPASREHRAQLRGRLLMARSRSVGLEDFRHRARQLGVTVESTVTGDRRELRGYLAQRAGAHDEWMRSDQLGAGLDIDAVRGRVQRDRENAR